MNTISPHGKGPYGPYGQGPQTRAGEIFGDIVVGSFVTVLASAATVVGIGMLAFAVASALQFLIAESGLLAAWTALTQLSQSVPLDEERIFALMFDNILFGALAGVMLGIMHFVLRWRRERDRWVVEALISPSSYAAASYGAVCLFLHVAISVVAAWALGALFGFFLPSPEALLAGDHAGVVFQTYFGAGGDGGGGEFVSELVLRILFILIFVLLIAAVLVCNVYAAAGWVFFRTASSTAAEGAIAGGASGVSAFAMAMMVRLLISRRRRDSGRKELRSVEYDLKEDGRSFGHAYVTGALAGAAHAVCYAAIVFGSAALYGIQVAP
jgi:hypothetical protein